jgi:hypothetical protein
METVMVARRVTHVPKTVVAVVVMVLVILERLQVHAAEIAAVPLVTSVLATAVS